MWHVRRTNTQVQPVGAQLAHSASALQLFGHVAVIEIHTL